MKHARFLFLLSIVTSGSVAVLFACSDDATTPTPTTGDGAADGSSSKDGAIGPGEQDGGGSGGKDSGSDSTSSSAKDANGPGEAGAECAFNRECQAALRCECSEAAGCACKPGGRGSGKNGIDACDSGEQCASSVCVESTTTADQFLCSNECVDPSECQPNLPRCLATFGFPAKICVRDPPK